MQTGFLTVQTVILLLASSIVGVVVFTAILEGAMSERRFAPVLLIGLVLVWAVIAFVATSIRGDLPSFIELLGTS